MIEVFDGRVERAVVHMGARLREWWGDDAGFRSLDGRAPVDSVENRAKLARFTLSMSGGFLSIGLVVLIVARLAGTELREQRFWPAIVVSVLGLTVVFPFVYVLILRLPLRLIHSIVPMATVMVISMGFLIGPDLPEAVIIGLVIASVVVAVAMQRNAALVHLAHLGAGYLVLISIQDGHPNPAALGLGIFGGVILIAVAVGSLVDRTRELARAEHAANAQLETAREELAALNRDLAARVREQVEEVARLTQLQGFLPAPVVEAVLTGGQDLLEPHRGEISVFFCDLRGFTRFASASPPEEVDELLRAYFELLGEALHRHEATVGAFTGDGLMAFFNDPLPCEDPAHRAIQMALELQHPIDELLASPRRRGHDLGFGVGIAMGYANIGMIGFEGRRDYTALGPVVNLAARLCAEAPAGGIWLDGRAAIAVEEDIVTGEPVEMMLKGFDRIISAHPVVVDWDAELRTGERTDQSAT